MADSHKREKIVRQLKVEIEWLEKELKKKMSQKKRREYEWQKTQKWLEICFLIV